MSKGMNLAIQELKENMAKVINESGLPIGVTQLVLSEITNQVAAANMQQIEKEKKLLEKEEEQEAEKDTDK